jgi:hypothetical protein
MDRWSSSSDLLAQVVLHRDRAEHVLDHRHERFHDALALCGHGREGRLLPGVQRLVELGGGNEVGQVLLVVLHDERHLLGHQPVRQQVDLHVLEGRLVLLHVAPARVRHEDHRVRAGQHHPAGGVVLDLAGDGVELDLEVVAGDGPQAEGKQVEEERAVLGGVERDQAVVAARVGDGVDLLEVRGLSRLRGTVVDHLGLDSPLGEVELDHEAA